MDPESWTLEVVCNRFPLRDWASPEEGDWFAGPAMREGDAWPSAVNAGQ